MILLLGGTHEGRDIATLLNQLNMVYTLSVATELGYDLYKEVAENCIVRRFSKAELLDYINVHGVELIIDATHPHALLVKEMATGAALEAGIPYFRYEREISEASSNHILKVNSMSDAIAVLKARVSPEDRILITGSKHIPDFLDHFDAKQCIFRIMPGNESMRICMDHQVPIENIIAVKAPCSIEFNQVLFKDYGITYFVFKNSGSGSALSSNLASLDGREVLGIVVEPERQKTAHVFQTLGALKTALENL